MNFKRLLTTKTGIFFISVLLGLGLATLFRKVCNDKNCIVFNGPVLSEIKDKIFEEDGKCYKYTLTKEACNSERQIVDVYSQPKNE